MGTPSLDHARSLGLRDLPVECSRCKARFVVPLSAIDLPGETALDQIVALWPVVCDECSGPCEVDLEAMGFHEK